GLAPRILKNLDGHAARAQELFLAEEGPVLADDDARNAVEENRAAAHGAGRECRVDRALTIDLRGAPAGVLERVHLAVEHDAAALHPPIVPAPEDAPAMDEHGADGNPALGQAALGLLDCGSKELVHFAIRPRALARDQITLSGSPRRPSSLASARHARVRVRWRGSRGDVLCDGHVGAR